jgi:hypothetical protein
MSAPPGGTVAPALLGLSPAAWFSAVGLPLDACEVDEARDYLSALGLPMAPRVEPVASWEHAERIIRNPSWDGTWWEREEHERRTLLARCFALHGEGVALEQLSLSAGVEHEVIHGAAALAASRAGMSDPALIRAAAGAASMAAHGLVLARLAKAREDHLFVRKYRLFEGGRWPLGLVGGVFHLF